MNCEKSVTIEEILVGRISAAHGLRGWVKIYSYTQPLEQILDYSPWQLRRNGQEREIEIEQGRKQGKGVVALLKEVEDRDQAEAMVGYDIWVSRSKLPELSSGDYYWHQLEGLSVVNQSEVIFGVIDHLMETGASDVMVIKSNGSDDTERLIPFVLDEVVVEVDLDKGIVIVDWEADY